MTQVTHEYRCVRHGRFDREVKFGESPPKSARCTKKLFGKLGKYPCGEPSYWMPPTVGVTWPGGKPSEQR